MIKNVTISQELAEAIEYFRDELKWSNKAIARLCINPGNRPYTPFEFEIKHILTIEHTTDEDLLMKALYIGYERMKTLEEAFRDLARERELWEGGEYAAGVFDTLDIIGERDPRYAYLREWAIGDFKQAIKGEVSKHGTL